MSQSANDFLAPSVPTGVTGTDVGTGRAFSNGAIDFSWTQPAGAYSATSYDLYITICNQGVCGTPTMINTGSASTTYRLEGLSSGSDATLQVAAKNASGTSDKSSATSPIVVTTVPEKPVSVTATDVGTNRPFNNGAASISYTAGATGGKAVSSYRATASAGGYSATDGFPIIVQGLQSETSYSFTVVATNANGDSEASTASNTITATTVPATPSAPSASSSSAGTDNVSWSPPANGGKAITNYRWTSDDGKAGDTSGTSVNVGQEQGTAQTYNVYATNANGNSGTSAQSGSVTTAFQAFGAFGAFGAFSAFGAFGAFGAFSAFGAFGAFGAFAAFGAFGAFYKSISLHTLVLTTNGYTQASNLKVGDELVSTEVPGLGINFTKQQVINWTGNPEDLQMIPDKVTTIVNIASSQAQESVSVNGEFYSGSHGMVVKRDGIARIIVTRDLLDTDELWSADTNTWTPITELIISNIAHEVISINCEPYDMFYTDHFLVYDGYQLED